MKITLLHNADALEPPVDPVLDQIDRRVARASVTRSTRCRSTATSLPIVTQLAERAARSRRSTSPSRSTERARSIRTWRRCSTFSDLRYTGSSPAGLIAAGDKSLTKKISSFHGIQTPQFATLYRGAVDWAGDLQLPADREAAAGGRVARHHVGVGRARDQGAVRHASASCRLEYQAPVLVEQYIEGREFYVGVLGNVNVEALPIIEMDFSGFPADRPRIASWAAKWGDDGEGSGAEFAGTKSIFPDGSATGARGANAEGGDRQRSRRCDCATMRGSTCACRRAGEIYVIEVNPNCYLERESEFARAAQKSGLEYQELIARIIDLATARYRTESLERTGLFDAEARRTQRNCARGDAPCARFRL